MSSRDIFTKFHQLTNENKIVYEAIPNVYFPALVERGKEIYKENRHQDESAYTFTLYDIHGDFRSHSFPAAEDFQNTVDTYFSPSIDDYQKAIAISVWAKKKVLQIQCMVRNRLLKTKKFRLKCPGIYLRIRPDASTTNAEVGHFNDGDIVDVFEEELNGFYKLVDGRVSSI